MLALLRCTDCHGAYYLGTPCAHHPHPTQLIRYQRVILEEAPCTRCGAPMEIAPGGHRQFCWPCKRDKKKAYMKLYTIRKKEHWLQTWASTITS